MDGKKTDRVAVSIRMRARVNELVPYAKGRLIRQASRFKVHLKYCYLNMANLINIGSFFGLLVKITTFVWQ